MTGFSAKKERESVLLMALVDAPGTPGTSSHRVRNLSRDGVCIEYPGRLEKQEQITVSIGQLDHLAAEVAWARGGFAGIRFCRPVDVMLARKHRSKITTVRAGWMAETDHAYRRKV